MEGLEPAGAFLADRYPLPGSELPLSVILARGPVEHLVFLEPPLLSVMALLLGTPLIRPALRIIVAYIV